MTKTMIGVVVALVVAGGAWYWYARDSKSKTADNETFGTYAYTCDNDVAFDLTLMTNTPSVTLKAKGAAPFTEVVLEQKSGATYATEEGEVALVGDGETITLTVGAATMTCNPVPSQTEAPFNWGGAGEGTQ